MKSQMEKLVESWDTQNELFFEDHLELCMEGYTSDAPLMKQRLLDLCRSEAHYSLKPIERKLLELYYENGYTTVTRANGRLFLSKPNSEEKNTMEIAQIDPSYLAGIDWGTESTLKIEDILNTYAMTESGTDHTKANINHGKVNIQNKKANFEPKKADIDEPHLTPEEHQTLRNLCYSKPTRFLYGDRNAITALGEYPKVTKHQSGILNIEFGEGWNEQVNIKNEWLYNRVKGKVIPIIDILNSDGLPKDTKGGVEMTPKDFTELTEAYRNNFTYVYDYEEQCLVSDGIAEYYDSSGMRYIPRGRTARFCPRTGELKKAITSAPQEINKLTAASRVENEMTSLLSGITMNQRDYDTLESLYFGKCLTYMTCDGESAYTVYRRMPPGIKEEQKTQHLLLHGRYKELEELAEEEPVFIGYILGHCKVEGGEE